MKTCCSCEESKEVTEFSKNKNGKDGLQRACKACVRAYHAANKDKIAKQKATYHAANKDKIAKQKATYRAANKEEINKRQATYYAANKDKFVAYYAANKDKSVAYRAANKEASKANSRKHSLRKYWPGQTNEQCQANYDKLMRTQGFRCGMCPVQQNELTYYLAVDHCHATDEVRGLLCSNCNTGLGKLGDTVEGLQRGIDYLRKSKARITSNR